jgi:hypothetical protein
MKKEIKPTPVLKTVQSFWTKLDMRKRVIAGLTAGMMAFGFGYYYTHAKTVADAVRTDMGQHTKVQFVVAGGKDSPWYSASKYTLLQDTSSYKDKHLTISIDRKACPNLTYRSLKGKTITVDGMLENYKGKSPSIRVTNPNQIVLN